MSKHHLTTGSRSPSSEEIADYMRIARIERSKAFHAVWMSILNDVKSLFVKPANRDAHSVSGLDARRA